MGEILEEHREYALIERMTDLLNDPPQTEYTETFCYAVFSSIIPWVCQRMRSPEYRFVFDQLATVSMPENLRNYFRMEQDFEIPNAGEALVAIRNAISHADARRVFPINSNGYLRGFKWVLTNKKDSRETEIGTLSMRTIGIQRFGTFYANYYCQSLRNYQSSQSDEQFYEAVSAALKEAA